MNHEKWLMREMETWRQEGVVDAAMIERLQARYLHVNTKASTWGRVIFSSLGALLIGQGVCALLAANWDALSRPVRAVISFLPLTFCVIAHFIGLKQERRTRSFLEPLGIFWGLSIGVGISLIAQTYHISGDPEAFVLTWTLLLLPVVYATQSLGATLGYFVGLLVWICMAQSSGGVGIFYWPLALLAVPLVMHVRQANPASLRAGFMIWGALLCSTIAVGVSLEKQLPGLWMLVYVGAFAAMFLGGMIGESEDEETSIWRTPLRTLGICGLTVTLSLLIAQWPWEDIGWRHWRIEESVHPWISLFDYVSAALLLIVSTVLLVVAGRKIPAVKWKGLQVVPVWTAWGVAPVVVAIAYSLGSYRDKGDEAAILMTVYFAGLGLATLAEGLIRKKLGQVNFGVLVLLEVILYKFFSSELGFTAKGLVFIASGCCFFAINAVASRQLKREGGAE